jgi:hypothetical protein
MTLAAWKEIAQLAQKLEQRMLPQLRAQHEDSAGEQEQAQRRAEQAPALRFP